MLALAHVLLSLIVTSDWQDMPFLASTMLTGLAARRTPLCTSAGLQPCFTSSTSCQAG
jgi:hypothetical protein